MLVGIVDYSTGHEISFRLFYLLPLALVGWFLSRRVVVAMSFITAGTWLVADTLSGQTYSHPLISYGNAVIEFVFFIAIALIISILSEAYQYQKGLARTDHLTDAPNSRSFYELAKSEISRARRYDHPFTIAYMDVDNFKSVNDKYGHAVGDRLLKTVTKVVRTNLRESDTVARLGGDEFAILLPETGNAAAETVIRKVRKTLLDEMRKNGWLVTFSIGVVTCIDPPKTVAEVVKWGDKLVYEAKNSGKNTVRYNVIQQNYPAQAKY